MSSKIFYLNCPTEIWPARSLTPVLSYMPKAVLFGWVCVVDWQATALATALCPSGRWLAPVRFQLLTIRALRPSSKFSRCPQWFQRRNQRPQDRIANTLPQVWLSEKNFGPQGGSRAQPNLICRPGRRPECRLAPPRTRSRLFPRPMRRHARAVVVTQRLQY